MFRGLSSDITLDIVKDTLICQATGVPTRRNTSNNKQSSTNEYSWKPYEYSLKPSRRAKYSRTKRRYRPCLVRHFRLSTWSHEIGHSLRGGAFVVVLVVLAVLAVPVFVALFYLDVMLKLVKQLSLPRR